MNASQQDPEPPSQAELNAEQARTWLNTLHGGAPGLINIVSTGNWSGQTFTTDDAGLDAAVNYIARLDRQKRSGIYARATTLKAAPRPGGRGEVNESLSFRGFWADIDIAGPGHATSKPLPPDIDAARHIVTTAGLPEPTLWIHSGGGLYPWWFLHDPHIIGDDLDDIVTLSARWQHVILAGSERLGYHYGTGVGDLSRVLRIPGTINRKEGLARPCIVLESSGVTYALDELAALLYSIDLPELRPADPRPTRTRHATFTTGTVGPYDALAEVAEWRDLLEPNDCRFVRSERDGAELWKYNGSSAESEYSIRAFPHALINHSESTPLPVGAGQRLTHGKTFAWWHHGGNHSAAGKDLVLAAAGNPAATTAARALPAPVLDHIRTRCGVRPWTPNTPPPTDTTPWPDSPTDHEPQPTGSNRTHDDEPWADHPDDSDKVTDAQIMAGLYIDEHAARAHFKDDTDDVDGGGAKPPPIDIATMLPAGMRTFVAAVAEHLQVPAEAPALMAISILSAATAGRVVADGRNGWRQPAIVWTATTMHSGERKTDVVRLAASPLRQIEQRMIGEYRDGVETFKQDKADLEALEKDLKQELRGARGADRARIENDLTEARTRLEEMPLDAGPMPAILVEDITVEALSQRLDENGQALGVISDEGGVFSLIAGRYSKDNGPNLDLYLKAYDQSPVRVDRVMRGSLMLTRPSLVVGLLAQPHVLEKAAGIDGAMERGLMGRFFLVFPESTLGKRQIDTPPISPVTVARWDAVVAYAYSLRVREDDEPHVLAIDDDAHQLLRELRMRLEPHLEPVVGRYAHMTDWAGKLAGKVLRLAAVFHLADLHPVAEPISTATMNHAIAFGIWSLRHAEHIYAGWQKRDGTPTSEGTEWVLEWLKRTGKAEFTVRDAQQSAKRAKWYSPAALQGALCGLVRSRHLASCVRTDGAGRKQASALFLVRGDR